MSCVDKFLLINFRLSFIMSGFFNLEEHWCKFRLSNIYIILLYCYAFTICFDIKLTWFKSSPIQDRSNGSNNGGPTQRASALAALNSAFTSSSSPRATSAPRSGGKGQGSQRAAAVAALSSVLTAEKKGSRENSPARPSRSPPAEASPTGIILLMTKPHYWRLSWIILMLFHNYDSFSFSLTSLDSFIRR